MKLGKKYLVLLVLGGGFPWQQPVYSQFKLVSSVVGAGAGLVANDSVRLYGTNGQPLIGVLQNGNFRLRAGFWYQTLRMITGVEKQPGTVLPAEFHLWQNYPNPFNPTTIISYALPKQSLVTLKIYDVLGRAVQTLVEETQEAGIYKVRLDASGLSSGVYFYRLVAGSFVDTKKLLLLR
jgi:hypothetical protein